jgi:mannose-6-phosphate isomerase-like protein (cupin superfamily)
MKKFITRVYGLQPVPNVCDQVLREVYKSEHFSVAHVEMAPGNISLPHRHAIFTEIYYILSGGGIISINGQEFPVAEGNTVGLSSGAVHQLKNTGATILKHLVISNPPFDPSDVEIITEALKNEVFKIPFKAPFIGKEEGEPFIARDGARIFELFQSSGLSIASGYLKPEQRALSHFHDSSEEIYYIISGSGEVKVGDVTEKIEAGDVVRMLPGETHALKNTSQTEIMKVLAISSPAYADDDIFFV